MDCEVKLMSRLNGVTAAADSAAVLGNKCTTVLVGSVNDSEDTSCDPQEMFSVGLEGICYFANDKKEVDKVSFERKIKNEDNDGKPNLKKQPSLKDLSAKVYDCEQSNHKCFHADLMEISCPALDRGSSKALLAGLDSKDVTIGCSTSDTHETSTKKILYDLNLDARDLLEEPGTAEGFLSIAKSPQMLDFQGDNSNGWDLNTSANEVQINLDSNAEQDPGPPIFDLALSADIESCSPRNGAQSLSVEMDNTWKGVQGRHEAAPPAASLSLSLALPCMDGKKQSSREVTSRDEQLSTKINPPFLLFGRPAEK